MLRSMTGFGRSVKKISAGRLTVEIKAVNHRFCEIKARLPQEWMSLEESISAYCRQRISRGKLDISFFLQAEGYRDRKVHIDWDILRQYEKRFEEIKKSTGAEESFPAAAMLQNEEIIYVLESEVNLDALKADIFPALQEAMDELLEMREREGELLYTDLKKRAEELAAKISVIEEHAPMIKEEYRTKLYVQMEKFLAGKELDENRLMTEIALYAEKADVSEELTRINSHLNQLISALNSGYSVGRKIDFIIQELNREINTIGSKANSSETGTIVVEMKDLLEKIREQVQNIE